MNSITVTLDPILLYTLPSSNPITPAPIIMRCSGTFSRARAPVELTNFFSSSSNPGRQIGSLPVARSTSLVSRFSILLSSVVTEIVLAFSSLPCPL